MRCTPFYCLVLSLFLLSACRDGSTVQKDPLSGVYAHPALQDLSRRIAKDPNNATLLFERAQALRKLKEDSLALIDLNKIVSLDTTKAAYFSAIGEILFDHKDIDGSKAWFQRAIRLDPKDPVSHLKLAKLLLFINENNEAFKEVNIVLRQNPYQPEAYFLKGMVYKNLNDSNRSLSSFQTAVQVDPTYQPALLQLAMLYEKKKDTLALQYYENAYRADTSDMTPLHGKAMFYQNLGRLAEAKATYRRCIEASPQYTDAAFNLGWILMYQDSFDLAVNMYDKVLHFDTTNVDAYYNKAVCLELTNQHEKALANYEQVLKLKPDHAEAMAAIKRLYK